MRESLEGEGGVAEKVKPLLVSYTIVRVRE